MDKRISFRSFLGISSKAWNVNANRPSAARCQRGSGAEDAAHVGRGCGPRRGASPHLSSPLGSSCSSSSLERPTFSSSWLSLSSSLVSCWLFSFSSTRSYRDSERTSVGWEPRGNGRPGRPQVLLEAG